MPSTFDGPNLLITLPAPTGGVLNLNWEDTYEEWLVWLNTGYGNRGYPPVFTEDFGGNPLTTGITAGAYFVFNNDLGWRIKPYEADHTIYAVGNLPPATDSLSIMVPTVGGYTVFIDGLQPVTQNVDSIINQQNENITNIQYHVESLRATHAAYGNIYFVDPVNGDDTNVGTSKETPVKLLQYAHDNLITDHNHDVVFILGANVVLDETLLFTKGDFSVRGTGEYTIIDPTSTLAHTVDVQGHMIHMQGFSIRIASGSAYRPLVITGDYFHGEGVEVKGQAQGVYIDTSFGSKFTDRSKLHGITNDHAITCGDGTNHLEIIDTHICTNSKSGIKVTGTSDVKAIAIKGNTCIQNCSEYGVDIDGGELFTIFNEVNVHHNTLGDVNDNGTQTHYRTAEDLIDVADAVLDELLAGHTTVGSLGQAIIDLLAAGGSLTAGQIALLEKAAKALKTGEFIALK